MAFDMRQISIQAYQNMFTLWHYQAQRTDDTIEDVKAPGYFSNAADMLTKGDWIMVSATDGATMLYVVKSPAVAEIARTPAVEVAG